MTAYPDQETVLVVPQADGARLVVAEQLVLVVRIQRDGVDEARVRCRGTGQRQSGRAVRRAGIAQPVDDLATQDAMNVESRAIYAEQVSFTEKF